MYRLRHTYNLLLIRPNSIARAKSPTSTAAAESHKMSARQATSPGTILPPATFTTTATLPSAVQSPGTPADSSQSTTTITAEPPNQSIVPSGTVSTPSVAAVAPTWIAEARQRFEKVFNLPNQTVIVGLWD